MNNREQNQPVIPNQSSGGKTQQSDEARTVLQQSQYGIFGVPFHVHNGVDSGQITSRDILGFPPALSQQIALYVTGTTVVDVFTTPTAQVTGTVTLFATVSHGSAGTAVLWGTTAGTIATIYCGGTAGVYVGSSSNVNARVVTGDTLHITPTGGSMTCLVDFIFPLT